MCDQTQVSYLPGDVVWVKLSKVWWPAEVQDESKLDEDVTGGLRKKPLAVVKFFNEDSYEFPKNFDQIYGYNCLRKDEFIKKGLDLRRRAAGSKDPNRSIPSSIDKFAADVVLAEQKTNGDPKYIDDPKFADTEENRRESPNESPSKKIKLDQVADVKQPKNPPRKSFRISANSSKVKLTKTKRTLSKSRVRVTQHSISKKKKKMIPKTTKISFVCPYCDVSSYVIHLLLHHIDDHFSGLIPGKIPAIPKGRANEYNKNASKIVQDTTEAIAGPSLESNEKVGKKRKSDMPSSPKKKKKLVVFPGKEKPSVSNKADKEAPVAPLKKRRKKKSEDAKDCSVTQASILADWDDFSEVEEKPKDSSCFDFNEDEDVINVEKPLKFGLKLPRVTNDKQPCSKPLIQTALRSDDELRKEVDSFLETTDTPLLPQIPSILDSGENNSSSLSKNHSGPKIVSNRSDDSSKKKKSEVDIRPSASDMAPLDDQTPQDKPLTKSSKKLQSLPRRRSSRFHSNEQEASTESDKQTEHNESALVSSGLSPVKKSQQGPILGSLDNDLGTENQLKGSASLNLTSDKSDPSKGVSGNDSGHFLELDSLKMKPPETESKAKRASDNVGLKTESKSVDNADTLHSPKSKRSFLTRSTPNESLKNICSQDQEETVKNEPRSKESIVTTKKSVVKSDIVNVKNKVEKKQKSSTRKSTRHDRTCLSTLKTEHPYLAQTENDSGMLGAGSQSPASGKSEETAIDSDHKSGESPVIEKCSVEKSDKVVVKDKVEKEKKSGTRKSARHDRTGQSALKTEHPNLAQTENDSGMLGAGSQSPASGKSEETAIDSDHKSGESPAIEKCSVEKSDKVVVKDKVEKEKKSGTRKSARHDRTGQSALKTEHPNLAQTENDTCMLGAGSQLPASGKSEETAVNSDLRSGESPVIEKCSVQKSDTVVVKDKVEKEQKSGSRKSARHDRTGQSTVKAEQPNLPLEKNPTCILESLTSSSGKLHEVEVKNISSEMASLQSPRSEDVCDKSVFGAQKKSIRTEELESGAFAPSSIALSTSAGKFEIKSELGRNALSPNDMNLIEKSESTSPPTVKELEESLSDPSVSSLSTEKSTKDQLESRIAGRESEKSGLLDHTTEKTRERRKSPRKLQSSLSAEETTTDVSGSSDIKSSQSDSRSQKVLSEPTKDEIEPLSSAPSQEFSCKIESNTEKPTPTHSNEEGKTSRISKEETVDFLKPIKDEKQLKSNVDKQKRILESDKEATRNSSKRVKLISEHSDAAGPSANQSTCTSSKSQTNSAAKIPSGEVDGKFESKSVMEKHKICLNETISSISSNEELPLMDSKNIKSDFIDTDKFSVGSEVRSFHQVKESELGMKEKYLSQTDREARTSPLKKETPSQKKEAPSLQKNEKSSTREKGTPSPQRKETPSSKKNETPSVLQKETSSSLKNETLTALKKVTPFTHKKETSSPQKKKTSSLQKKETSSLQKKEAVSLQKKETPSAQKNEIPSNQKKEISSPQKKETSLPNKNETLSPQKIKTLSAQRKETPSTQKNVTLSPQKIEIPSLQKKESSSPKKKEIPSIQKKESASTRKREMPSPQGEESSSPHKKDTPSAQKMITPSPQNKETSSPPMKEMPSAQKKDISSPHKRETPTPQEEETFSPHKKDTPSAQKMITPSPQNKETSSPHKRETPTPQEEETSSPQKKETPSAQKIKTPSSQNKETSSLQMKETLSPQEEETSSPQKKETLSGQKQGISSPQKRETPSAQEEETSSPKKKETPSAQKIKTPTPQNKETLSSQKKESPSAQKKDISSPQKRETPSALEEETSSPQNKETSSSKKKESSSAQKKDTSSPQKRETPSAQEEETSSPKKKETRSAQKIKTPLLQNKETSSSQKKETPSAQKKETPSAIEEETSSPQKKETPSAQTIGISLPKKIETPIAQKNETLSAPKKDTPSTQWKETFSPHKKETPSAQKNETPSRSKKETPSAPKKETPSAPKKETPSAPKKDTPSPQVVETSSRQKKEISSTQKIETPLSQSKEARNTQTTKTIETLLPLEEETSSPQKKETPLAQKISTSASEEIKTTSPKKKEASVAPKKGAPSPQGVLSSSTSSPQKKEAPSTQKIETPSSENKETSSSSQKKETPSDLRNEIITLSKKETPSLQKKEAPSTQKIETPSSQYKEASSSPQKKEAPSTQKIETLSSQYKEASSSPQKKEAPSTQKIETPSSQYKEASSSPQKKEASSTQKIETPSFQNKEASSSPQKKEAPSTQKIETPSSQYKEASSSPQKKEAPSTQKIETLSSQYKEASSSPQKKEAPSTQKIETPSSQYKEASSSPQKKEASSTQKIETPSFQNKEASSSPQKKEAPSDLRNEILTLSKKETPSAQKKEAISNLCSKLESVKVEKRKSEELKNDRRQRHDYPSKSKESEKQNKSDRTTSRSDERKYEKRHSDRHDKKKDSRRRSTDRDERRSDSRSSSSSRRREYREERHRSDRHRREESRHSSRSDERRRNEKSDYRERHKESDREKRHAPSSKERASSSTEQSLVSSPSLPDPTKVNQHTSRLTQVASVEERSAVQVSTATPQHSSQDVPSFLGENKKIVEYSSDRMSASKIDGLCQLPTPVDEPSAHLKFKSLEPFSSRGTLKSDPDLSVNDLSATMGASQRSIQVVISMSRKQNDNSAVASTESASVTGVLKEEPLPAQAGSQEPASALLRDNYYEKDPIVFNQRTDSDKLNSEISDLPQTPDDVITTQIVSSHHLPAISTFSQASDGKASFQSDSDSIPTEISNQNLVPNLEPVEPHVNLEVNTGLSSNNNILMTDPLYFGEQCFLPVTSEVTVYTDTSVDASAGRLSVPDPQVLAEPLETALVAREVQVSSSVEPSRRSASLTPEDLASANISSPPNDMGLSEEMDFNNLTLIQDICVGNHFDDIPGAKVIEVFVQRIGEPVPEKFKEAEKFIIKHDPVLENPKLPPFPHYKEEEMKVESPKLKPKSSVSAARISVTSQSNGKVKSQSASSHASMKTDQVPPLVLKQGIQNPQKQLVMIPGKTSAANTVVTSTSFKNLKIVNKSVPITLSGKLSKNSAGQIIITSSPGMSKSVLLKPGPVSIGKSASTSLEAGQTRQVKPQTATKSSIVIQTTSGLLTTSPITQLQPEKKTANLPSKPHKIPNILQKSVSTVQTQSAKKDVGSQVFAKANKSSTQAAGTSAQPAAAPSPREVLIVTLDKYGKYVSAKPSPLVRQSTNSQRKTPLLPPAGGKGGAQVRVQKTGPHQDILAEALANTMVLQSDLAESEVPPPPSLSSGVLETSLTLGQPIMTPLEVPSSIPVIDGQTFYISNASGFQILNTDSIVIPSEVASALPSEELKAQESSSGKDDNALPEFLKGDFSKKSQTTSKLSSDR